MALDLNDPAQLAQYLALYNQMTPDDFAQTLLQAQQGQYAQGAGESSYTHSGYFDPALNAWMGIQAPSSENALGGLGATLAAGSVLIGPALGAALGGAGAATGGVGNVGDAYSGISNDFLDSLASGAGAGSGAAGAVGDITNGYGISPDFLSGGSGAGTATITPYPQIGAGSITGAPIDAAGNVIGPSSSFGTSSIPYYASAPAVASGAANAAASLPSGTAAGANGLPDATNPTGGVDTGNPVGGSGAPNVASSIPSWLSALSPYAGLIGSGLGLLDSALQPKSTTQTNQGSGNSTSTSTLQLPSQLTGAAGTALDRANQLLTQGQQFAPTPYILNQAAGNLAGLGQNTAPTTSSFASGANINPYLDTEFNAAADATQNRLASEFANAGQYGSPQNTQARSQELQQLAAGIYGPGYQNAQNLQYGAQEAGVQRGLTQQDSNLNRTLQAAQVALPLGQYMQQNQQTQLNAPYTNLSQYLGQLGAVSPFFPGTAQQSQSGTQTGSYTQPLYNNPLTSAIGGASLGSYFGSLFGQPTQQTPGAYNGMQTPQMANVGQGFGSMPAYSYL